jgi:hypothetical protein
MTTEMETSTICKIRTKRARTATFRKRAARGEATFTREVMT